MGMNLIRERKPDLVILDVYRGAAAQGGEKVGVEILKRIKESGFTPVVMYTALPDGLDDHCGPFVRLVCKDANGLSNLESAMSELFELRIPQINHAITNHIDRTMRSYMWGFVQENWSEFGALIDKPEFLRLIVQRLALTLARHGIDEMAREVYADNAAAPTPHDEAVHPAEYYIKPPIKSHPMLGDIRKRNNGENSEYLVVLWPSCDMVRSEEREPNTNAVLCARAQVADDVEEIQEWQADPSESKKKGVMALLRNRRKRQGKSPDRYHFLPGVWDIPHLVVDFQALEHIHLETICQQTCLATLASPFAEALAGRFQKYIGRIGTPDLNLEAVLVQLQDRTPPPPTAAK